MQRTIVVQHRSLHVSRRRWIAVGMVALFFAVPRLLATEPPVDYGVVLQVLSNQVSRSAGTVVRGTCLREFERVMRLAPATEARGPVTATMELRFEAACYVWGYASRARTISNSGLPTGVMVPLEMECVRSNDLCLDITTAAAAGAGQTNTAARGQEARMGVEEHEAGFPSYPVLPHAVLATLSKLKAPTARVIDREAALAGAAGSRVIRIEGSPRYSSEERWEIDFDPDAAMLPVRTRFCSADGTLLLQATAASLSTQAWPPREVLIEVYNAGKLTWREKYNDITVARRTGGGFEAVSIRPGALVEDHRLPVPVTYTMGYRPPTDAELLAMQGNPEAAIAYLRAASTGRAVSGETSWYLMGVLLLLVLGVPTALRLARRVRAAS